MECLSCRQRWPMAGLWLWWSLVFLVPSISCAAIFPATADGIDGWVMAMLLTGIFGGSACLAVAITIAPHQRRILCEPSAHTHTWEEAPHHFFGTKVWTCQTCGNSKLGEGDGPPQ